MNSKYLKKELCAQRPQPEYRKLNIYVVVISAMIVVIGLSMIAMSKWYELSINLTHSLPGHVYLVKKDGQFQKQEIVAFKWERDFAYPKGTTFIKYLVGGPGDTVTTRGRNVYVNGSLIGYAKEAGITGVRLDVVQPTMLGSNQYFFYTTHKDSFDSRYIQFGFIGKEQIIGRAYELF